MKARQVAPGFSSVYALGMMEQIRVIERGADGLWGDWQPANANARRIVHGGDVVAAIGLDDRVSVLQRSPRLPWHTWDLKAAELSLTHLDDGGPALFASEPDGRLWHTWKHSPAGALDSLDSAGRSLQARSRRR